MLPFYFASTWHLPLDISQLIYVFFDAYWSFAKASNSKYLVSVAICKKCIDTLHVIRRQQKFIIAEKLGLTGEKHVCVCVYNVNGKLTCGPQPEWDQLSILVHEVYGSILQKLCWRGDVESLEISRVPISGWEPICFSFLFCVKGELLIYG